MQDNDSQRSRSYRMGPEGESWVGVQLPPKELAVTAAVRSSGEASFVGTVVAHNWRGWGVAPFTLQPMAELRRRDHVHRRKRSRS